VSTVYEEGPFRRWQAISFPAPALYVSSSTVVTQTTPAGTTLGYHFVTFAPFPSGTVVDSLEPFLGVVTGKQSGASVDFSLLTLPTPPFTSTVDDFPGGSSGPCAGRAVVGTYYLSTGAAYPSGGTERVENIGGARDFRPSFNLQQLVVSNRSGLITVETSPGFFNCVYDADNETTELAFILNEECTVA